MPEFRDLGALNSAFPYLIRSKVDVLTPYKVTVVVLIQNYLKSKFNKSDVGLKQRAQARRKFCVLLLKLTQMPDMSFCDLYSNLISGFSGTDGIFADFQRTMNKLARCGIEHILDLYDSQTSMEKIISESAGISQHGIVGLYIRRVTVTMDKMTFPEMLILHKNLKRYHAKGLRFFDICPSMKETYTSLNSSGIGNVKLGRWSQKQAELFISQQSSFMENNEQNAVAPSRLQVSISAIIEDNPLLSQAHFLSYMNYLRLRDVITSLEFLHKTFDRNLTCSLNSTETRGFQYSILNLAIFNTVFNHKSTAEGCLRECAMISKQAGDRNCLEHSNAWHCILRTDYVKPSEKCISEESEMTFGQVSSLSMQFIVKVAGLRGYKPAAVLDALFKSDELNCRNYFSELAINSIVERAAIWTLHGENVICSLYAQLLLELNQARMFSKLFNNEATCKALSMIALYFGTQGEYGLAYVLFHNAKIHLHRNPHSNIFLACRSYVNHGEAILRQRWRESQDSSCLLITFDRTAALLQQASSLIARGNMAVALKILNKFKKTTDPLVFIRTLILLSCSSPSSSFLTGIKISILTAALVKARKICFRYDASIVNMLFSHVLLTIGLLHQANYNIQTCLANVSSNGSLYDKAKYSILFVKSIVTEAPTREDKLKRMNDCITVINQAVEYFKRLEAHSKVKDSFAYVALFYNNMGLICERNKYSLLFRQHDQNFPTSKEYMYKIY